MSKSADISGTIAISMILAPIKKSTDMEDAELEGHLPTNSIPPQKKKTANLI